MDWLRRAIYVAALVTAVGASAMIALDSGLPIGPVILALGLVPIAGLLLAGRPLTRAVPDMIFGALDTGLLTLPALGGGLLFGVAGAIAGGVVGDALSDAVAGFFEGTVEEWLEERGISASREAVTTALGKMTGCLLGSGLVLSTALIFGIQPGFTA